MNYLLCYRYPHSQVKFTKEEQVNNPEFRHSPHPPYLNQFADLCMEISMITAEINETLDLVLCLDDEDCTAAPFYICQEEGFVSGSGGSGEGVTREGVGSGSGLGSSGSGDDGLRDTEEGDTGVGVEVPSTPGLESPLTSYSTPPQNTTEPAETPEVEEYTVVDIIPNSEATNKTTNSSSSDRPSITEVTTTLPKVTPTSLPDVMEPSSLPPTDDKPTTVPRNTPTVPSVEVDTVDSSNEVDGVSHLVSLAKELKSANFTFLSALAVFLPFLM